MNCPACGKDTVDGAAFCQHCGARLGGCCPICGNPIVENALFCQCCGAVELLRACVVSEN